jgi:hypothetical protein
LEERLKDLAEGKVVPKGKTVVEAAKEWLAFRERYGKGNTKADLMGGASSSSGARRRTYTCSVP